MNDSRPWWLWPNLLALDAPAVAVTWQVFLAAGAGVRVPPAASAVLALVVWGVYLADRGLDARGGSDSTDRHRTAGRNLSAWCAAAGGALAAAAALALVGLPRAHLAVGCAVAGATAVYFGAIHLLGVGRVLGRGAKEAAVGGVFAAGAAVPLIAGAEPLVPSVAGVVAFAGLCWLNCALISVWEEGAAGGPPLWVPAAAAALALAAAGGAPPAVGVAVAVSAAALGGLHLGRARVPVRGRRVLADVVLLSPLLVPVWS